MADARLVSGEGKTDICINLWAPEVPRGAPSTPLLWGHGLDLLGLGGYVESAGLPPQESLLWTLKEQTKGAQPPRADFATGN